MVGSVLVGIHRLGLVEHSFQLVGLFALSLAVERFGLVDDRLQRLLQ